MSEKTYDPHFNAEPQKTGEPTSKPITADPKFTKDGGDGLIKKPSGK